MRSFKPCALYAALLLGSIALTACGGSAKPKPTSKTKLAAQKSTPPAAPTAWATCQPAVAVTAGVVVQCTHRTLILSKWTEASSTQVLGEIQAQLSDSSKKISSGTHMLTLGNQRRKGVRYSQKKPNRQGVIIALERNGQTRTANCMFIDTRHLKQCEADLLEFAQAGQLPAHLEIKTPEVSKPLVPRLMGKALLVPTSCRWYKQKIQCTDGSFLLWRPLEQGEGASFEKTFIEQLRRGLVAQSDRVQQLKGRCRTLGQDVACTRFVSTSRKFGRNTVHVAPASRLGQRAIVMCSSPSTRSPKAIPAVCQQVMTWLKATKEPKQDSKETLR